MVAEGSRGFGRPLEEREDEFVRQNWQLMTDREIGKRLGRSEVSVTSRRGSSLRLLRAENKPKDPSMRAWSPEDDEVLQEMFSAEFGDEEIAIRLGRTLQAVAQRRSSMGLLRQRSGREAGRTDVWTDADDNVVRYLFTRGWSDERIGEAVEKTACSVKDRRQTLGLWRAPRR